MKQYPVGEVRSSGWSKIPPHVDGDEGDDDG